MGGDKCVKRSDPLPLGFKKCPYFTVLFNQLSAVKRQDRQRQEEFIKGLLVSGFVCAFRNSVLKFRMGYRRNGEILNRILLKFS